MPAAGADAKRAEQQLHAVVPVVSVHRRRHHGRCPTGGSSSSRLLLISACLCCCCCLLFSTHTASAAVPRGTPPVPPLKASSSGTALAVAATAPPPPPPFKPTGTIMDLIMTSPKWTPLATAIDTLLAPDIVSFLMSPKSAYTFFAPDNAAFEVTALSLSLPGGGAALLENPLLAAVIETQISTVVFKGESYRRHLLQHLYCSRHALL